MNPHTLVILVGLPRSGKTTWARRRGAPIVCPDAIRLALHGRRFLAQAEPMVWAIAKIMVRALFNAGHHTVILDACNVSPKRRDEWAGPWGVEYQVIDTPPETCIARAQAEGDTEIIPIIERMVAEWDLTGTGYAQG